MSAQSPTRSNFLRPCKVILDITLMQTMRSKKTLLMLIVTFLPVLLASYYRIFGGNMWISPEQALSHLMTFFLLFLSILVALFYGATLIADEVDNRTIVYLFTRPIRKYSIVLGKFAAYILESLLVLVPPIVLTFFIIVTDSRMISSFASNLYVFSRQFGVIVLALIVYGAIFTLFGVSLKRPVLFGLILAFGWEKMVLVIPGIVRKFSVVHYLLSIFPKDETTRVIMRVVGMPQSIAPALSSPVLSAIILLVVTCIFFGLSIFTIHNKEYRFE